MTTGSRVDAIERSVEKANVWLRDLAAALDHGDRVAAYRILRATLHTLRDRLTVDESAQLAAQLPTLVRGVFYEGWDPSRTPMRYHSAGEFLKRVAGEARLRGETEASYAVAAVARLLREHVSAGELDDVLHVLPHQIRALFAELEPRDFAGGMRASRPGTPESQS
jgi:uncharacterized protein (DUF2267 family)